jgi:protein gp37
MIFVNSMSYLFHKDVAEDYILAVVKMMELANWHTYQVLTKRSERMRDLLSTKLKDAAALPHIWWCVSVENKRHGLPRIDHLRQAPAAVRFLSIEPLLEDLGPINLEGISWAIVGGESGARARPLAEEWALSIRHQCRQAQVPFFFKQWGGWNKKAAGRTLQGGTYDEYPPRVQNPVVGRAERMALIAQVGAVSGEF